MGICWTLCPRELGCVAKVSTVAPGASAQECSAPFTISLQGWSSHLQIGQFKWKKASDHRRVKINIDQTGCRQRVTQSEEFNRAPTETWEWGGQTWNIRIRREHNVRNPRVTLVGKSARATAALKPYLLRGTINNPQMQRSLWSATKGKICFALISGSSQMVPCTIMYMY